MLVITVALAFGSLTQGEPRQAPGASRLRPPTEFACNRNDLTSYTGVVVRYERAKNQTTLRIRTDAETTETVTLRHPGTNDPSTMFRFGGKAFVAADWGRIERAVGVLRPVTRASAWVCSDGQVMIDWEAPKN